MEKPSSSGRAALEEEKSLVEVGKLFFFFLISNLCKQVDITHPMF